MARCGPALQGLQEQTPPAIFPSVANLCRCCNWPVLQPLLEHMDERNGCSEIIFTFSVSSFHTGKMVPHDKEQRTSTWTFSYSQLLVIDCYVLGFAIWALKQLEEETCRTITKWPNVSRLYQCSTQRASSFSLKPFRDTVLAENMFTAKENRNMHLFLADGTHITGSDCLFCCRIRPIVHIFTWQCFHCR